MMTCGEALELIAFTLLENDKLIENFIEKQRKHAEENFFFKMKMEEKENYLQRKARI